MVQKKKRLSINLKELTWSLHAVKGPTRRLVYREHLPVQNDQFSLFQRMSFDITKLPSHLIIVKIRLVATPNDQVVLLFNKILFYQDVSLFFLSSDGAINILAIIKFSAFFSTVVTRKATLCAGCKSQLIHEEMPHDRGTQWDLGLDRGTRHWH